MNKDLSAKIKVLSFIAAIFVVLIHVGGQLDCDVWVNRVYLIFVRQGIYSFAVPFFFVVSGYFFMNHYDGSLEWWRVALLKRVKSLLIPFLIWNVLYIVLIRLPNGRNFDFLQDFGISTVTPANSPLWYVKVLFQMCLISPVIIWFVKRIRNCMLVLILGISVFLLGLDLPGWMTYWRAILYFSFGIWLALGGSRFACLLRNKFVILSIGVGYMILMSVRYVLSITDFDLFSRVWLYVPVVLLPLVWRLYDCFLKFPWIRKMGDGHLFCGFSFFIYCSHRILIDIGCRYVNLRSLHGSLMLGLSVVAVSLGIGYFLRCFVPKVYLFLMGGRG